MDACETLFERAGEGDCDAVRPLVAPRTIWFGRALLREEWTPSSIPMRRMAAERPRIENRLAIDRSFLSAVPRGAYYEFAGRAFGETGSSGQWLKLDLNCTQAGMVTVLVNLNTDGLVCCVRDGTHLADAVAWLKSQTQAPVLHRAHCLTAVG